MQDIMDSNPIISGVGTFTPPKPPPENMKDKVEDDPEKTPDEKE